MIRSAAVDLGASSGRVIGGSFDGSKLHMEEIHRFSNQPITVLGRMYWNAYRLYADMREGIIKSAKALGRIDSIGIDTWAVDYGLLDVYGMLLNLPRHYRDMRTDGMMDKVTERIDRKSLFDRTGIQFMSINTIFQLAAELEQNPAVLERAAHLLLMPDLLNYFLTGQIQSEFTNATTTQLLNAVNGDWDQTLLKQLGIPCRLFTRIAMPGTKLGAIADAELLQYPELRSTHVVHVASHDTASAVIAVPAKEQAHAYISSGTWSLFGTTVPEPIINEQTEAMNFTNEGGFNNYRLLKNIMGLWLIQQTQDSFEAQGAPSDILTLMQMAEKSPAFSFYFDTEDARLLHPGDIPARIREICEETGQAQPVSHGALVRGILENLAFKYRYTLEQLERILGNRVETIHIVGGGAQNELLCQFTANVTNRPVLAGPIEASAMGNLLMQLWALGELKGTAQLRELVLRSCVTKAYEPIDADVWEDQYGQYLQKMATIQQSNIMNVN
jgi:rhamnulokinase